LKVFHLGLDVNHQRTYQLQTQFLILMLVVGIGCNRESEPKSVPRVQFDTIPSEPTSLKKSRASDQVSIPQDSLPPSFGANDVLGSLGSNSGGSVAATSGMTAGANVAEADPIDYMELERQIGQAEALAATGQFSKAAGIAQKVASEPIPDPTTPLMKAFDWYLRDADLAKAEQVCLQAIQDSPDDPRSHRALAQLLNAEGRRFEASKHVQQLIRLGNAFPREVLSLIDLSGPFDLVSFREIVGEGKGTMFDLGVARRRFVAEDKPDEALEILKQLSLKYQHPAIAALQGRILAEQMRLEDLISWAENLPEGTDEQPEYWLALGLWCVFQQRDQEAIRALAETLSRDSTNRRAIRAMAAAFGRMGELELAKKAQQNLGVLDSIFRDASSADVEQSMRIANDFHQMQRYWESVVWFRQSFEMAGVLEQKADELNARVGQIREWESSVALGEIGRMQVQKIFGFRIQDYPVIATSELALSMNRQDSPPQETVASGSEMVFHDVALEMNLSTSFVSDYSVDEVDFWLYQANGGGLGAFDFDLDGNCDLYLVQTGGNPRVEGSSEPNQLFRNFDGVTYSDVSAQSNAQDRGYGQGVCAADLNQDGWLDLIVANIGKNSIYLNQGDGTFEYVENRERFDDAGDWTSSIAVGDLDGDHLPDLVEVNYLDDPTIFERKCVGKQLDCTPQRFRAAIDRFYRGQPDGSFQRWDGAIESADKPNYGFGAILTNIDGAAGNDLFVSNDGDVNHLWRSHLSESASRDDEDLSGLQAKRYRLSEVGAIAGCSIGVSGLSQACMGIASGDFDRNGTLDLMITNFYNEPLNLFLQMSPGLFVDESLKYGMAQSAKNVLGFGVQTVDFDSDGWLDAAVGNGHLYDARYADIPFQMQSQLFRGGSNGFVLQDPSTAGQYWRRQHLARTLVVCDVNGDGSMDMISSHLDQPISVLANRSESGNWCQLELVGVDSERDSIGAKVTIQCDKERWTSWVTSGDGYMCTNEPVMHFGVGDYDRIDRIEVEWPSGKSQLIENQPVNHRYLMVEGDLPYQR
jgi:tetratricopeptide (TPR) repeat protein